MLVSPEQGHDVRLENLLVGACVHMTIEKVQRGAVIVAEGAPNHDAASSPAVGLQDAGVCIPLSGPSPHS